MGFPLFFLGGLLPAVLAQSTTTVNFFYGTPLSVATPIVTGSVISADATAATYAMDCGSYLKDLGCTKPVTVTIGPSLQVFSYIGDVLGFSASCTFTGQTKGVCGVGVTINSIATAITTTFDDSTFPGFLKASITAGAEKLTAVVTPTPIAASTSTGNSTIVASNSTSHSHSDHSHSSTSSTSSTSKASTSRQPSATAIASPSPSKAVAPVAHGSPAFGIVAMAILGLVAL